MFILNASFGLESQEYLFHNAVIFSFLGARISVVDQNPKESASFGWILKRK
jgi:hypothetical protein